MMMSNKEIKGFIQLMAAAIVFGLCFVGQKKGSNTVGPLMFNFLRLVVGSFFITPVIYILNQRKENETASHNSQDNIVLNQSRKFSLIDNSDSSESSSSLSAPTEVEDDDDLNGFIHNKSTLLPSSSSSSSPQLLPHHVVTPMSPCKALISKNYVLMAILIAGMNMTFASTCQQIGIHYTSAGVAGFITGFSLVLVPLLGCLAFGHETNKVTWFSAILALAGIFLLSSSEDDGSGSSDSSGSNSSSGSDVVDGPAYTYTHTDLFLPACAFLMAIGILIVDYFVRRGVDPGVLTSGQFITSTCVSFVLMLIFENPVSADSVDFTAIYDARYPIISVGVLEVVGYTLAAHGQESASPAAAALVMAMESPFAVFAGMIFLDEKLGMREIIGCGSMLTAVLLSVYYGGGGHGNNDDRQRNNESKQGV